MTARDRTVLMVVAVLALVGAFWFAALKPRSKEAKDLDAKINVAQQRLDTATASTQAAQAAKATYDSDYAAVAKLGKAVPSDDDVPSLLYQLQQASDRAKVDFRSIAVSGASGTAPTPVAQNTGAQVAALGNAQKGKTTSTPSSAPAPAAAPAGAAAATQTAVAALPPGAIVGSAGFATMPFDFSFNGRFFTLEKFLDELKAFTRVDGDTISVRGRLMTIDGIALTSAPKGFPAMTAKVHATAYLLPADQAQASGAAAGAPASATGPSGPTGPATTKTASTSAPNPAAGVR